MNSQQKVDQLLDSLPTVLRDAGEAGEQFNALLITARSFGIDPAEYIRALLPTDPGELDNVLVWLAGQALTCRSDDASQLVIGLDGGTIYALDEIPRDGGATVHHLPPREPTEDGEAGEEGAA